MLPSTCVVVPTYWTRAGGSRRPGDAVYDHPTPLDGESTLEPLLASLEKLPKTFYLVLIVAVTGDDAAEASVAQVRRLADRYTGIPTLVFGPAQLSWLHGWLNRRALPEATDFLDLQQYPRIRNLQLAIPHALHSEAVVAIDDDEIVTDPAFFEKATEPLGREVNGAGVDGLSGYYLQRDGGILLQVDPGKARAPNLFDRKAAIMNSATERLEAMPDEIVETPFCFGGNMEFTPDLMAAVGFDPGITRGEDIDYLINARLEGRRFFMRKDLRILHCPPEGGSYKDTNVSKLEQDILRFVYEEEKLRASHTVDGLETVTADDLVPYPGDFLRPDLDDEAAEALDQAGYDGDARDYVEEARATARQRITRYLRFRVEWPMVMQALYDDATVRDKLLSEVRGA